MLNKGELGGLGPHSVEWVVSRVSVWHRGCTGSVRGVLGLLGREHWGSGLGVIPGMVPMVYGVPGSGGSLGGNSRAVAVVSG